jgi:outer membrane lipoprotein-sorting protein
MKHARYFFPVRFFALIMSFLFFAAAITPAQKMPVDEIIAKHLNSIGTADARQKLKDQVASGTVQFTVLRQGGTAGEGRIVFASEGMKTLLGMTFNTPIYPAETIVFDGKKTKVAFTTNNQRSPLGDFIYRYQDTIKEGLMGGVLSTGWALNDASMRKAKIENDGTKKIGDRQAIALSFSPKGGSDLQIKIFLDARTYEHFRTEYRRIISAQQGRTADTSAQRREEKQLMVEEFSNFKKEKGLNLPRNYRINIVLEGERETREYEWKAEFAQFFFNQQLDPKSFNVD